MYQDKTLICKDCGAEFIWSAGEQEFFAQKGFDKPPTRCPEDRKKRRNEKQGAAPSTGPKPLFDITCANCGKTGQVPFEPTSARILCADCFRAQATPMTPGGAAKSSAADTTPTTDADDVVPAQTIDAAADSEPEAVAVAPANETPEPSA